MKVKARLARRGPGRDQALDELRKTMAAAEWKDWEPASHVTLTWKTGTSAGYWAAITLETSLP
jgi:hypothetical protein